MARFRADQLAAIRAYFKAQGVLEVETPVLSAGISLDCHIDVFSSRFHPDGTDKGAAGRDVYLQTSPEFHMKRLLCRGYPDIFQISKVFRNGESGRWHNPEFTMVEWYRKGFSLDDLIEDVAGVCRTVLGDKPILRCAYADCVRAATGVDPLTANTDEWADFLSSRGDETRLTTKADYLNYVMGSYVEATLPADKLVFVHHFPSELACLAVLDAQDSRTAQRFELYFRGVELCNAYVELLDAKEYRTRFEAENLKRRNEGKPTLPLDENFLGEMAVSMPPCAGVALGMDRLIALAGGASGLSEVLAFSWNEA